MLASHRNPFQIAPLAGAGWIGHWNLVRCEVAKMSLDHKSNWRGARTVALRREPRPECQDFFSELVSEGQLLMVAGGPGGLRQELVAAMDFNGNLGWIRPEYLRIISAAQDQALDLGQLADGSTLVQARRRHPTRPPLHLARPIPAGCWAAQLTFRLSVAAPEWRLRGPGREPELFGAAGSGGGPAGQRWNPMIYFPLPGA